MEHIVNEELQNDDVAVVVGVSINYLLVMCVSGIFMPVCMYVRELLVKQGKSLAKKQRYLNIKHVFVLETEHTLTATFINTHKETIKFEKNNSNELFS